MFNELRRFEQPIHWTMVGGGADGTKPLARGVVSAGNRTKWETF